MKRTAALSIASLGVLFFTSVAPASAQSLGDIGRVLLNNVLGNSSTYVDPYYSGYSGYTGYTYPSTSYYNYPTTSYYGSYPNTYYTNPYYTGYSSSSYNSYNAYPSYSSYGTSSYYYDSTLGRWIDRSRSNVAGRVLDWLF